MLFGKYVHEMKTIGYAIINPFTHGLHEVLLANNIK